ncbi:MAG: hypothetical protein AAF511_10680 [Pseudomonadota bacterium]
MALLRDHSEELDELRMLIEDLDASGLTISRGLDFKRLVHDQQLRNLGVTLWREYQARISVSRERFEAVLEKEDVTFADLWAPGVTEQVDTGSSEDELSAYRRKLELRIELLELLLRESRDDLARSMRWAAKDAAPAGNEREPV